MAQTLLTLIASWTLAGIFMVAAVHKTRNYLEFVGILNQYKLLPNFSIPYVAPLVIAAELAGAAALLTVLTRDMGLAICVGLLGIYILAIGINLARGRAAIDCGCGGEATPLSVWLVLRNVVLIILASTAWSTTEATMSFSIYLLAATTTALLWLIYVTGNQLLANWGKRQTPADQHG
ncbi:MAG: methylamine utilization protein MauE [Gammaproteobacteria bacterium]|nr:methylamine utilization protein MauE [Gammaproteobacteria bacterium]